MLCSRPQSSLDRRFNRGFAAKTTWTSPERPKLSGVVLRLRSVPARSCLPRSLSRLTGNHTPPPTLLNTHHPPFTPSIHAVCLRPTTSYPSSSPCEHRAAALSNLPAFFLSFVQQSPALLLSLSCDDWPLSQSFHQPFEHFTHDSLHDISLSILIARLPRHTRAANLYPTRGRLR